MEAADSAAAAGDYVSAETLLRKAARLQESSLGPLHPDLANTLNNLGVVYEMTGKPGDAEGCFRRAWAIASAALPPDHPFVATSRKNLEDFCAARGRPVEAQPDAPRPVVARRWPHFLEVGALIVAGLLVTILATVTWYRTSDQAGSRPGSPNAPSRATVAAPKPSPRSSTPAPKAGGAIARPSPAPPARERRAPGSSAVRTPGVVDARLCKEFSTVGPRAWQCVPPGDPVRPGPLVFYTRITSPADTAVEHRWYFGNYRVQVVELRVRASGESGYRTYSRHTIGPERSGDWRVELRSQAGELLHEARFVVR